ncbi:RNA polymerase sigma factor [Pedobacter rhizosphaerae]|uniref:RNA polymerase sigma-70 factor, ECF subfamily n=1 Tax=Pedobacter rhizosphaerae TaxID=390241 RepID=A0A1H9PLR1_9SPHI|nr:RNA polymerase sigma-70 factor [Pedobacter rhizosphaerae]SER49152.1 RNA polymerase sigma-70 factor, ECF subfamily [Pedobacter rhizosphaerae]
MPVSLLLNEKELLIKIAKGDRYAFTTVFNHYQNFVFSFAKRITHSDDMALEIVQDVFLNIWNTRSRLEDIESFGAYLNRLVRNRAFNVLRDLSKKANLTVDLEQAEGKAEASTLEQLDYRETLRIVDQAISGLSPQQQLAYQLCHQQGLKYEEAGKQMGISPQTVHVHMRSALKKIREHLKRNAIAFPLLVMVLLK